MSKQYTKAELNQIIRDVLCGALEHMEAIKTELRKFDLKDEKTCDPVILSRAKVLTLTLTCINDIIHPAHKLCYQLFSNNSEYFDILVKNHKHAFEKKMLPPCFCETCKLYIQAEKDKNGKETETAENSFAGTISDVRPESGTKSV